MPEHYFDLTPGEQKEILQFSAAKLGRDALVLEKDIWVCWVLGALFSIPDARPMAFKGGTSLSKVYDAINRFSEDIDITLDYRSFEAFDPFSGATSNTQLKKFSQRLKDYVKHYANDVVVPFIQTELNRLGFSEMCSIEVDDTGEKIWVSYPSVIEARDEYLKSQVLIELGGRNVIDPNECHSVEPYVSPLIPDLVFPKGLVTVLSSERTFWEKATLIHVECNRNKLRENAQRLSRHCYDLVMLFRHDCGQNAIRNRGLLEDVVQHKKIFFNASYAHYDACLNQCFNLLPEADSLRELKLDYQRMIDAGMIYENALSFDEVVSTIQEIEKIINAG